MFGPAICSGANLTNVSGQLAVLEIIAIGRGLVIVAAVALFIRRGRRAAGA